MDDREGLFCLMAVSWVTQKDCFASRPCCIGDKKIVFSVYFVVLVTQELLCLLAVLNELCNVIFLPIVMLAA